MPICRCAIVLRSRSSALAASRHPSRCTDPGAIWQARRHRIHTGPLRIGGATAFAPPSPFAEHAAALPCPAVIPCATGAFATHLGAETMDRLVLPQLEAVPVRAGAAVPV